MPNLNIQPALSVAGTRGIFLNAAQAQFDSRVQSKILALASTVADLLFVSEVVPGVNSLLVVYDPRKLSAITLMQTLSQLWDEAPDTEIEGRLFEIPVFYGGTRGEDLGDCASHGGVSIEEFVRIHGESEYRVACLGAMPGFPYLTGMDSRLIIARRSTPRLSLAGGSVTIGGSHAGITPCTAPSGWHVIGYTDTQLFDSNAAVALLKPGDRIRFVSRGIAS